VAEYLQENSITRTTLSAAFVGEQLVNMRTGRIAKILLSRVFTPTGSMKISSLLKDFLTGS